MSDSKSGSKSNLNESNMPLLSEEAEKAGDTPEKEVQEMELEEKKDETTEKEEEKKETKAKKEKKKKEKKEKVKKEPGPSCIEIHSAGLNLENRDSDCLNDEVNIEFSSVFAEPAAAHGFEGVWKLNYVMFNQTKLWIYKILAALISLPLALIWAVVFSLLTLLYVWVMKPVLALFTVFMGVFKKVWMTVVDSTLAPVCRAIGLACNRTQVVPHLVEQA